MNIDRYILRRSKRYFLIGCMQHVRSTQIRSDYYGGQTAEAKIKADIESPLVLEKPAAWRKPAADNPHMAAMLRLSSSGP